MKSKILGLLAVASLSGPVQALSKPVVVWDTLQATPGVFGVQVGCLCAFPTDKNYIQGVPVVPAQTGYLAALSFFGAKFNLGEDGWAFAVRTDDGGQPGEIVEWLSPIAVGNDPAIYGGVASGNALLAAGTKYWFTASLPSPSAGLWYTNDNVKGTIASSSDDGSTWMLSSDFWVMQLRVIADVPTSVPEPGTLALLGLGLTGLGLSRRRRAT